MQQPPFHGSDRTKKRFLQRERRKIRGQSLPKEINQSPTKQVVDDPTIKS
jgi:hypothetical protein